MKSKYQYTPGEILTTRDGKTTLLTYLGEDQVLSGRRRKVKVKCLCGKEWGVQLGNILSATTVCCGRYPCRTYKYLYEGRRDPEVGFKALMYVYKKHATDRNLKFHLTYDEFKNLTQLNCHYCGIPPQQVYVLKKKGTDEVRAGVPVTYNGVDRIDSSLNYTIDNTVPCCKVCNRAKMEMSYEDFREWVQRIYKHLNK